MSAVRALRLIFANATAAAKTACRHKYDFSTPQGRREAVDNFKASCNNEQFRRKQFPIYHSIVSHLAQEHEFPLIEEIVESQKQYKDISDEGFVVRLISLYGEAGMVNHARNLFDEMPSFNSPRTVQSFTALLKAYTSAGRYDAAYNLFREFPSKYSIEVDVFSYNVAIHALCQLNSTDSALSMLCEMEELGLKPNRITFYTLLEAFYFLPRRGAEGEKIWAVMVAHYNICPDVACYAVKISGMILDGRVTEAVELVDELIVNGVELDVRVFNILINGFGRYWKMEEAEHGYGELGRGCIADRVHHMILIPLLKEAMRGGKLLIDVEVLKQVAEGFVAKRMIEEANELANKISEFDS